ncbi:MAG: diguanylate cyclase [Zhenhengia sp.]|jgi:diguanylate cyclase (GGDEF)-like protein/putative nucleotidyltransferase with HDIG domain|uniref:bifunctional diguanylate cyclase/phosphohydrolase n=1 Tax=Zhenhengia sp. TaxID=2944208 RepID=UPI0029114319|nr:diguanylate cyclase [Clostridiales bacterium]MDU6973110.1 diguanylate cyclase [Clostridiales bacterium]
MHKRLEDTKYEQVNNILVVVKLSALLFCGIICFKYLATKTITGSLEEYGSAFSMLFIALFLLGIYLIWSTVAVRQFSEKRKKYKQVIENCIFIAIFFVMILISGGPDSPHKFLFLFTIMTTTIQSGMKNGMVMAAVSAVLILLVDLVFFPALEINPYFEDDLILVGIFVLTAAPLGYYVKLGNEHIEELKEMVNRDGLTSMYNHRFFQDALRENIYVASQSNQPISMLFLDIDNFKYYNDLNGHQKGDEVLKEVAKLIEGSVRKGDLVARYGGEEFAIILPNTDREESIKVAETVRKKVQDTYIMGQENQPTGNLTISIGIATYPDNAKDELGLIKSADDALYRAKFFKKNRVEVYVSVLDELKREINDDHNELVTSIKTLISVINAKDKYTYGHCERVVMYSRIIADYLGLSEKDKKTLVYGAYMHDIGKINIPEQILNKKMPLDQAEWEMLKKHPEHGVEIIKTVDSLKEIIPLILHHHEKYDGTGYPNGMKGEEIPLLARILTIVDSFDAMTSNRPYHTRRKSDEDAFVELRACKGIQFDPELVETFIKALTIAKQELEIYN